MLGGAKHVGGCTNEVGGGGGVRTPRKSASDRMVTITKLYILKSILRFLLQFLLGGLTWAILHVWTQNL